MTTAYFPKDDSPEWKRVSKECLPKAGSEVFTKIDDANGVRNKQILVRKRNLWFTQDLSMYVYYTPTHWQY